MFLNARSFHFDLTDRVLVMGVVNVTPDSFSDGGKFLDPRKTLEQALKLVDEGADILDIGAVSTRPGAAQVSLDEERNRLMPVLEKICSRISCPISVDTTSSQIARVALELGTHIINDVSGLKADPEIARIAAEFHAGLILMHRRGTPETMQQFTGYEDLISEIKDELRGSIKAALSRGVSRESIVIDPGIGFSKTVEQNLEILRRLQEFEDIGLPVMVGTSRKSFIGHVLNREIEDRVSGTLASCIFAVNQGARILRVHDVRQVKDAVQLTLAIRENSSHVGAF